MRDLSRIAEHHQADLQHVELVADAGATQTLLPGRRLRRALLWRCLLLAGFAGVCALGFG